jgi:hypothetical protein
VLGTKFGGKIAIEIGGCSIHVCENVTTVYTGTTKNQINLF